MKPPFKVKVGKVSWFTSMRNAAVLTWWAPVGLMEMLKVSVVQMAVSVFFFLRAAIMIPITIFMWIVTLCAVIGAGLAGRLNIIEAAEEVQS